MDPDEIIAKLQAGEFGAGAVSSEPQVEVFLGQDDGFYSPFANKEAGEGIRIPSNRPPKEKKATVDVASGLIYGWSDARLKKWEKLLLDNGVIQPGEYDWGTLVSVWQSAVEEAGRLYTLGGKKVTPEQFIEMYLGSMKGAAGSGGPTTTTSVDRSVQEVDDLDARAAAEEAYQALLGRKASGKEADALRQALNTYAKANPLVTRRTTTVGKDGDSSTTTNTSGGLSAQGAQQIVMDQARAEPNYAEFQAASTMFNWLTQALGPTADV